MVKLYNFGGNTLVGFPGKLKEGNMTVKMGNSPQGKSPQNFYGNEIEKEDWVKLSDEDITFEKCSANDPEVIGYVGSEPEIEGVQELEDKTWGNYTPRTATIKLLGSFVRSIKLNDNNQEINVGDSVKVGTTGRFQKGNNDNTIALESAAADSGSIIAVLFGFYGNFE
jgi:hypothetical protein